MVVGIGNNIQGQAWDIQTQTNMDKHSDFAMQDLVKQTKVQNTFN